MKTALHTGSKKIPNCPENTDKFSQNSEYGSFGGFTECKPDEMEASGAFILEKCKMTYTGILSFSGLPICQNALTNINS